MAQSFKHIKVTPATDDEVVIIAGRRTSEEADDAPAEATRLASAMPVDGTDASTMIDEKVSSAKANPAKPASEAKEAKDAYHPTTLEDIESSKMPKTQIVVIVVAIVVLIAFAVWFFILS